MKPMDLTKSTELDRGAWIRTLEEASASGCHFAEDKIKGAQFFIAGAAGALLLYVNFLAERLAIEPISNVPGIIRIFYFISASLLVFALFTFSLSYNAVSNAKAELYRAQIDIKLRNNIDKASARIGVALAQLCKCQGRHFIGLVAFSCGVVALVLCLSHELSIFNAFRPSQIIQGIFEI